MQRKNILRKVYVIMGLLLIEESASDIDKETTRDMIKYFRKINKQALIEKQLIFQEAQLPRLLPIKIMYLKSWLTASYFFLIT